MELGYAETAYFLALLSALLSFTTKNAWIMPGIQRQIVSRTLTSAWTGLPANRTASGGKMTHRTYSTFHLGRGV